MDTPRVSVVMPAYNHERFVAAAVDSVLDQTYQDLELIVIDDGSTDATGEIVRAYSDPRIRYYHQQNQDAGNSLNRGMSLSDGYYISIINSDDVYAPDRLRRLVELQLQTSAECIGSDVTPGDYKWDPVTIVSNISEYCDLKRTCNQATVIHVCAHNIDNYQCP